METQTITDRDDYLAALYCRADQWHSYGTPMADVIGDIMMHCAITGEIFIDEDEEGAMGNERGTQMKTSEISEDGIIATVTNDAGRRFNVRLVCDDDSYGLNDKLTHTGDPMLEFYDASQSVKKFGARGQFVTRYMLHTLDGSGPYGERSPSRGLSLDLSIPAWTISAKNLTDSIDAAHRVLEINPDDLEINYVK